MDIDTEIDIQINQLQTGIDNIRLELGIDGVQVHTSSNDGADASIYSRLNNGGACAYEYGQNQHNNNYCTTSPLDENTNCIDSTNSTGVKISFGNTAEFAEEHTKGPVACSLSRQADLDNTLCKPLEKRSFKDKSASTTLGSEKLKLKTITKNIFKATAIIDKKMKSARSNVTVAPSQKCLYCGECFDSERSRRKHVEKMHYWNHLCIICGRSFIYETSLSIHRGSIHC